MIRLVALDLDGTLIDENLAVSARVREAIAAAQAQGVVVTLATGRMLDFVLPIARDLDISAPLICYQGGVIQSPDSQIPLYRATMDSALVREVLAWQEQHRWQLALYANSDVYLNERKWPESFLRDMVGERLIWVDDLFAVVEEHEPVKFVVVAEPSDADQIEREMGSLFGKRMEIVRSHSMFVEGNPPGVSKGDALNRLASHLGICQAEVMAVGDQGNDVSMIAWAGVGVAMSNGSPTVKAIADWIAPPLEEDGAAVAIERFALTGSQSLQDE